MVWKNPQQWFRSTITHRRFQSPKCCANVESHKKLLCCLSLILLCVLGGVIALVVVLVKPTGNTGPTPASCEDLLKPLIIETTKGAIFLGNWTLNEAYSSDPIDVYALKYTTSSWAEYSLGKDGRVNLEMGHMLHNYKNETIKCVYHHFQYMTLANNTLHVSLPEYNASATVQFLKTCDECLVWSMLAFVPGYDPLIYLLVYTRDGIISENALQKTREQAVCLEFQTPPPFHYNGTGEFCHDDMDGTALRHASGRHFHIPSLDQD